MKKIVLK